MIEDWCTTVCGAVVCVAELCVEIVECILVESLIKVSRIEVFFAEILRVDVFRVFAVGRVMTGSTDIFTVGRIMTGSTDIFDVGRIMTGSTGIVPSALLVRLAVEPARTVQSQTSVTSWTLSEARGETCPVVLSPRQPLREQLQRGGHTMLANPGKRQAALQCSAPRGRYSGRVFRKLFNVSKASSWRHGPLTCIAGCGCEISIKWLARDDWSSQDQDGNLIGRFHIRHKRQAEHSTASACGRLYQQG